MKLRWLAVSVIIMIALTIAGSAPSCQHDNCSDCIQEPTCMWCSKDMNDTSEFSRCISSESSQASTWRSTCEQININDPEVYFELEENMDFSEGDEVDQIIQMKPQKVNVDLRAQEPYSLKFQYRHASNYPADLYYLMDGSMSMQDDREVLSGLGSVLADSIKNITSNFRLGFGIFVDKPILPYVSTSPSAQTCKDCSLPYGFQNALPLTHDVSLFESKVKEAKNARNMDFPEGGLDALMQAMVCEKEIDWRKQSLRLVVLSTDAGFHYAGDGKLGGVLEPNDMFCHLDETGSYTNFQFSDYPSVSQINHMAKEHSINLIFAINENQEPLYARLSQHIEGASAGRLAEDSANIVELLTDKVKDIISTVELRDNSTSPVRIRYFSKCMDGQRKERSSCNNLKPGDQVEYELEFTIEECPESESLQHQYVSIYPTGRQETVDINITMLCRCKCEEPGDQGYIVDADQCNNHGDYKCGVCSCKEGYLGRYCECEASQVAGTNVTSDEACRMTNTSKVCSGMGTCFCGECQCNQRESPSEIISGKFCECTNYLDCTGKNGLSCSGNGECECSKCKCKDGWVGQFCDCPDSEENCKNPETKEICSSSGSCECNQCKCNSQYFGKWCEDCPDCSGKCVAYKSCVQCQVFNTGEYSPEICHSNCTLFNSTIVSAAEVKGASNERLCSFFDDNDCRFVFVYGQRDDGTVEVRVQEALECPKPVKIWGVIIGVLTAVVVIGLVALLVWRVTVTIHDRREYQKFILDQRDAKWSENENPLYKKATTTVQNPLFGQNN